MVIERYSVYFIARQNKEYEDGSSGKCKKILTTYQFQETLNIKYERRNQL